MRHSLVIHRLIKKRAELAGQHKIAAKAADTIKADLDAIDRALVASGVMPTMPGSAKGLRKEPAKIIVDFFDRIDQHPTRILDVGCGQGRDALLLARRGHHAIGVDLSPNGIRALYATAKREALAIEGVIADITSYKPDGQFDTIRLDWTLHMLPKPDRLAVLSLMLGHVRESGCVLIAANRRTSRNSRR